VGDVGEVRMTETRSYRCVNCSEEETTSPSCEPHVVVDANKCPVVGSDPVCQGRYKATKDGVCTFTWDNSFSRLRGKQVEICTYSLIQLSL